MNVLKAMDRYWKELIQVSSSKNDIKVLYLYNSAMNLLIATYNITATYNTSYESLVACGRCPTRRDTKPHHFHYLHSRLGPLGHQNTIEKQNRPLPFKFLTCLKC